MSPQRTLLTRTASSNRHRFPYPSAAKAFFKIIKRADESGYIEQVCAFLDSVLVRTIRQQQPFSFPQNVLASLPTDSSLITTIRHLENGGHEIEEMEG